MKAYVTLLGTNSFFKGTMGLWQSLQNVGATYPLVVIINSSINKMNRYLLEKKGITYYEMEDLTYPKGTSEAMAKDGWGNWSIENLQTTIQKFHIFKMTQYEKLVFLDSDMLVVKNIDYLFDKPNHSAARDCGPVYYLYPNIFGKGSFSESYYWGLNAGLLVVEPKIEDYNNLMQMMQKFPNCEQTILREYWSEWATTPALQLPPCTNMFVPYLTMYLHSDLCKLQDIEVFHFIGFKPFHKVQIDITTAEGLVEKLYMETIEQAFEIKDDIRPILFDDKVFEVPIGGYSFKRLKNFIAIYLKRNVPEHSTVLDVGCGQGIYAQLLRQFYVMDGLDIFPAHRNELTEYLYRNIFITDIRSYAYDWYDLIIMGDVLEHLSIVDGQKVITYAKEHSKFILVVIPYCMEQVFTEGNTAETHLQPDITHEIFLERYSDFHLIRGDQYHGYYFWKKP